MQPTDNSTSGSSKIAGVVVALAESSVRHSNVWLVGFALVFAGLVAVGANVQTRLDKADFLPADATRPDSSDQALLDQFGGAGRIVVYLALSDSIGLGDVRPLLDTIAVRAASIAGIRSVRSGPSDASSEFISDVLPSRIALYLDTAHLREIGDRISRAGIAKAVAVYAAKRATEEGPALVRSNDPLGIVGFAWSAAASVVGSSPIRVANGYYTDRSRHHFFVIADLDPELNTIEDWSAITADFQRLIDSITADGQWREVLESTRLGVIGRPVSYASATAALQDDVRRTGAAAVVVVLVLLGVLFRSIIAPIIVLIPAVFGLALAMATGFVTFGTISVMSLIFVGPLIGLGVDFGIHVVTHYRLPDRSMRRRDKIVFAVRQPGRAILFAGLTSAAAFVSLGSLSYPVTRQVAVLATAGIIGTIVATFTLLPAVLSVTRVSPIGLAGGTRWMERLYPADRRQRAIVSVLLVIVFAAAIPAAMTVQFEPHPWSLAVRGNPKTAELNQLNEELGVSFVPLLLVSRGGTPEEAIERDRTAHRQLRAGVQRADVVAVETLSQWLPPLDQQRANAELVRTSGELFSRERFVSDYDDAVSAVSGADSVFTASYRDGIAAYLDPDLSPIARSAVSFVADRHLVAEGEGYAAISYLYPRQFPWASGALDPLRDTFRLLRLDDLEGTRLIGEALRSHGHAYALTRELARALFVVGILVIFLLWTQFRDVKALALCLLPPAVGIAVVLIVMALGGIPLNMLTLSITPLLVGIGIDDGIHVVERLRVGQPVRLIFREAGTSMTFTTLTTVAAFACMAFAQFDGVQEMGLLGAVGMVTALLAAGSLASLAKLSEDSCQLSDQGEG